jgi:hypothetical protein
MRKVRRAGIRPGKRRRLDAAARTGARVKIDAHQGPVGYGAGDYRRPRFLDFQVPAAAMARLRDAYEAGDDTLVRDIMSQIVADNAWPDWTPPGGWDFGSVDNFDWEPR